MRRLQDYLEATLHAGLRLAPWADTSGVPVYLTREFGLWRGELLGEKLLFVMDGQAVDLTPGDLAKRIERLTKAFNGPAVFVTDSMTGYQRGRLIEAGVPFVVPGNQLYLPNVGLDLREHFRRRSETPDDRLSPAAQVLLLRHLTLGDVDGQAPGRLVDVVRYSAMTCGRAIEEIAAHGLAEIHSRGRSKIILFRLPEEEVFHLAEPLLRPPVRAQHWYRARRIPKGFYGTTLPQDLAKGGESALAEISQLSPPPKPVFAAGPKDWKRVQAGDYGDQVPISDEPDFGIDVWWYDPDQIVPRHQPDRISLYLQFREHADERVAAAAREAMTEFAWYRD
ncbi:hypothetical protein [Pseudogemmobacter bohemicus]|uniref:hypothetical protein n=1 Tax=Pseudogemmobacter bohemicus TaxID=2250708 RepID=UPI001E628583|nr:hypothetical protein [Pseudogemmobacter bohemicus]